MDMKRQIFAVATRKATVAQRGPTQAAKRVQTVLAKDKLRPAKDGAAGAGGVVEAITTEITPDDMRALVLLAALDMEDAMVAFVTENKDIITRFRISGTETLMAKLKKVLGESLHVAIEYKSSLLGADSQCATQMVLEDVGLLIYFTNPLKHEPYQADADALLRLINVGNVLHATNPTTAISMLHVLKEGLNGKPELIPSFFTTLESPSVAEYKAQQAAVVAKVSARVAPAKNSEPAPVVPPEIVREAEENQDHQKTFEPAQADTNSNGIRVSVLASKFQKKLLGLPKTKPSIKKKVSLQNFEQEAYEQKLLANANEMRCLALVAHNNMKTAMQDFVMANQTILRRFRLTGTASTMKMLRSVLGDDISYGPTCSSGPLGGDAQLSAQMCLEDIGGVIFFTDPLSPHPHMADVNSLVRLINVNNVLHATNPTTAVALVEIFKKGVDGKPELIPSFYETLETPAAKMEGGMAAKLPSPLLLTTVALGAGLAAALATKMLSR